MQSSMTSIGREGRQVPPTCLPLLQRAAGPDGSERRAALQEIARIYWRPLYCYLIGRGVDREDAKDLVQGFFAGVIEREVCSQFDPARGRFRTFLLTCLQSFVSKARRSGSALKRGGGRRFVSVDELDAAPAETGESGELDGGFLREWAAAHLRHATQRALREIELRGDARLMAAACAYVSADDPRRPSHRRIAESTGLTEPQVRHLAHGLRRRVRQILLEELRLETATEGDAHEELAYLLERLEAA